MLEQLNNYNIKLEKNPNHNVNISPWPILISFSILQLVLSLLYYINTSNYYLFVFSLLQFSFYLLNWFFSIIVEATFEGNHTLIIQKNIRFAMLLFIMSEIMFFFSFLISFFYYSIVPSIWIGCIWPPIGIQIIDPYSLPLFNTAILLSSGISITYAHSMIVLGDYLKLNLALIITIFLGLLFLFIQYFEYNYSQFSIEDSVYGSIFYLLTGFHGLHVLIGLLFLVICFYRSWNYHFTREHHVGLECAIWYWHFVDIVWFLLYIFLYY